MGLKEEINNDLKTSMKNHDKIKLSVLRMLNSDIKNKEIELIKKIGDDEIVKIVKSGIKKRRDAIELYKQGKRDDLAEKEGSEIKVLEKYLPAQMDMETIKIVVKNVIDKAGYKGPEDYGVVMKEVMKDINGKADGKEVSAVVKNELSKNQ